MKRGTLVALAILAVLLVMYVVTSDEPPSTERSPTTIEKVEGLGKIAIERPGAAEESDESGDSKPESTKITLEKRDGEWWVVEPVESPAAGKLADQISKLFGASIGTDDLPISSDKASDYKVDDESGIRLLLFAADASKPDVELLVGKQIEVEQTGAKRTFIRRAGQEKIYRAQSALGDFVRKPVDEFRSKSIASFDKEKVFRLEWEKPNGEQLTLQKLEDDEEWQLKWPKAEWELDKGRVDSILSVLSDLTASDFADDKKKADIGLDPPTTTMTIKAVENEVSLFLGRVGEGEDAAYYVKTDDEPYQYKLSRYAGRQLIAEPSDVRSKTPRSFDKASISEVRFPGEDRVVVRKEDGSWKLVRPDSDEPLNTSKFESRLGKLASLEVKGFPEVSPADAGLEAGAERLTFKTKEGEQAILLGDTVDEESGDRYVRFEGGDEVFVLSKFNAQQLTPTVDDLVGEKSGPKMPAKGMPGKGMPGGMNNAQKMKMMQQLRQKMGK